MNLGSAFFLTPIFFAIFTITGSARALNQEIKYSTPVPQTEIDFLDEDLGRPLQFTDDIPDFKNLMELKTLNFDSLKSWLGERVGYVISEGEDPTDKLSVVQENYLYQNPNVFPDIEKPSPDGPQRNYGSDLDPQKTGAVMTNIGLTFYLNGKKNRQLFGYDFTGGQEKDLLKMTSPRVGVLQVGEGLFAKRMSDDTSRSYASTIYRLAILFHEAHHGDGNGKSLGFIHAICPKESPYYNTLSCDRMANGAYTVEAEFIRHAVVPCHDQKKCSDDEAERLSFVGIDALDRVLSTEIVDPRPEGVTASPLRESP